MRRHGVLLALAFIAGSAGCSSFLATAVRNLTELPIQACDETKLEWRNRRRAERAWAGVKHGVEGPAWTKDYANGFMDGYADYLTNGGNGEPPATPPFHYRLHHYQTPDGLRAMDEWFAGFRHGAAMAQASGERETIVIPLSAAPINALGRYPDSNAPPALAPAVEPEELKPPKKLSRSKKLATATPQEG
jgi:hypothetical protein